MAGVGGGIAALVVGGAALLLLSRQAAPPVTPPATPAAQQLAGVSGTSAPPTASAAPAASPVAPATTPDLAASAPLPAAVQPPAPAPAAAAAVPAAGTEPATAQGAGSAAGADAANVTQAAITLPPMRSPQADIPVHAATAAQIENRGATDFSVFRLQENPSILVLDFDTLADQGRMLDRAAALIEKAGLPKDRVLSVPEVHDAVRRLGDTPDGFYYGHDYSAAALSRFFSLAERDRLPLRPEEQLLRRLMGQEGLLAAGARGGLISLPRVDAAANITSAIRAAILTHELSHGEYFTNPDYVRYVHDFWLSHLSEKERGSVRSFLAREGYDVAQEELLENEMQAYMMFTTDPHFFAPSRVGMTPERRNDVRVAFMRGMPAGWLKDMLAGSLRGGQP